MVFHRDLLLQGFIFRFHVRRIRVLVPRLGSVGFESEMSMCFFENSSSHNHGSLENWNVVWMSEYSMVWGEWLACILIFVLFKLKHSLLSLVMTIWYTSSISDYLFYSSSPCSTSCCCLLFVVCCLLFVACCLLLVACCWLFVVVCCWLSHPFIIQHQTSGTSNWKALPPCSAAWPRLLGSDRSWNFPRSVSGVALLVRFLSKRHIGKFHFPFFSRIFLWVALIRFLIQRNIGKFTSAWTVYSNSCVFKRVRSKS